MRIFVVTLSLLLAPVTHAQESQSSQASEISLLSGLFKKQDSEVQNDDAGGQTTLNIAGRFSQSIAAGAAWLLEGEINLTSYEAPKGASDPDDDTSIALALGYRHIFPKLTEKLFPYVQGRGGIKHIKATDTTATSSTTETSLFYATDIGFNLYVDTWAFFLFEIPLFESKLYGKVEKETETADTKTESEDTHYEIFASTTSTLPTTKVGLGILF